mgnify:CR=1 FL=1
MYDRRLEAITAAAELGSFSRAAAKLRVSTPALVKQVSGFEAEFGITLFERSHSGVKVTPAGALLVDDARSIMRQSEDALRRARRAAGDGGAVRLGVSMMCPGRQTLSMWTGVHELEPSLRFEIVPVSDLYDERESVMRSLGREVDVVQSSFSTPRWGDACQKLRIVNVPFISTCSAQAGSRARRALRLPTWRACACACFVTVTTPWTAFVSTFWPTAAWT